MGFFTFILCGLSGILLQGPAQQEATPVSKIIQDLRKQHKIEIVYKAGDIADKDGQEFKVVGKVLDWSLEDALRAIALSCGLERVKISDQRYVLKRRLPGLGPALRARLEKLEALRADMLALDRRLRDLEADARGTARRLDDVERDVDQIDAELSLLKLSK